MPKTHSPFNNPKIHKILNCSLALLRDHGDHGLTMRQVAAKAGMSLSNLQYYFKTKNELLKGMVDYYFQKCEDEFDANLDVAENDDARRKVYKLIAIHLVHDETLSEICKIFRELWAIATRNEEINAYLVLYYRRYAEKLTEELVPLTVKPEVVPQVISLLIPYFEGYSITANSVPLNVDQAADMLTDVTMSILEGTIGEGSSSV